MNILVDIGNTTIAIALYEHSMFKEKFIISTQIEKMEDEYLLTLENLMKDVDSTKVKHILISSVVPKVTRTIKAVLERMFGVNATVVGIGFRTGVMICIDNPGELGTDLVCDIVGGANKYASPMIIVDMGTATKLLVIDKQAHFIGCIIAPGILTSAATLIQKTSLLPQTDLVYPKSIIGKNTSDSLKSGMVVGHAEMIKGLCSQVEAKLGYSCNKILTGGNSYSVKEYLENSGFLSNDNLLFEGLNVILKKNLVKD